MRQYGLQKIENPLVKNVTIPTIFKLKAYFATDTVAISIGKIELIMKRSLAVITITAIAEGINGAPYLRTFFKI